MSDPAYCDLAGEHPFQLFVALDEWRSLGLDRESKFNGLRLELRCELVRYQADRVIERKEVRRDQPAEQSVAGRDVGDVLVTCSLSRLAQQWLGLRKSRCDAVAHRRLRDHVHSVQPR